VVLLHDRGLDCSFVDVVVYLAVESPVGDFETVVAGDGDGLELLAAEDGAVAEAADGGRSR
jgi:hypothetical protein